MIEDDIKRSGYFPLQEQLLRIIEKKTGNDSHSYFRIVISFYLAQIASCMRARIQGMLFKDIPVNMYACTLMPSGSGKGISQTVLEDSVVDQFRRKFMEDIAPMAADAHIDKMVESRSLSSNLDPEQIRAQLQEEYKSYGSMPYSFDSGTGPAFKQARAKMQMANCGALSFICDEIGSNIINNEEIISICLEVFDMGKTKNKLTKDTAQNKRVQDREMGVPTNMLWFGTPSKLLNGGKEEDFFYNYLQAGMSRRLFFGEGIKKPSKYKTGKEKRDALLAEKPDDILKSISDKLKGLAVLTRLNNDIALLDAEEELVCDYQIWCEQRAELIEKQTGGVNEEVRLAELKNRYFKALKLAGAYAFIDESDVITKQHLLQAIKLTEDSGEAFIRILHRDPVYVRLAKYVAANPRPLNYADLSEALPFFKGSKSQLNDLISMATSWAYNNSIIIKSYNRGDVEFLQGQKLEETKLDEMIFSISSDLTYHYDNLIKPWDKLTVLGQNNGLNWCVHHFLPDMSKPSLGNYRAKEFATPAFNLLVLDVDGTCTLESAKDILKDYTYMIYTTKRHTAEANRFRVVLPLKYKLFLNPEDYKEFMTNVFESLPFDIDDQAKDIARKWLTNNGQVFTNSGELFDPRPFIPESEQDKERKKEMKKWGNLDNIARWFLKNTKSGNRNNNLFRYGIMLRDRGLSFDDIKDTVIQLNSKLIAPLEIDELENTVFNSISAA